MKLYYKVLNVSPNAKLSEIKKSYKRLALIWHPDRNSSPEAEDKFKEIAEAYEILSDTDKRKKYDSGFIFDNEDFKSPFETFYDLFPEINPELLSNLNEIIDNVTTFDKTQIDFSKPIYQIYLNVKKQINFSNTENLMLNLMKQYEQYSKSKKKPENATPKKTFQNYSENLTYILNINLYDYYTYTKKDISVDIVSKCYICEDESRINCFLCKGNIYYTSNNTYSIPLKEYEIILPKQGNHLPNCIYPGNLTFYLEDKSHPYYSRHNDYDLMHENFVTSQNIELNKYSIPFLDNTEIEICDISTILEKEYIIENKGLPYTENGIDKRGNLYVYLKFNN